MSMPAVGDLAPEIALPDETGTVHRLADQRGRWTILYFYPKDDTPGCTVEACEFRDANETIHGARRRRLGDQPAGRDEQAHVPREVRPAVHAPRRRGPRRRRGATARGSRRRTTARRTWASRAGHFLVDPDGRIARAWPKVKPEGHAAEVLAALDEAAGRARLGDRRRDGAGHAKEASLVGGDERSLGRNEDSARGGSRAKPRRTHPTPDAAS